MDGIRWFKTIINIDEDVGPQLGPGICVYCAGRLCLRKKSFVEVTGRERSMLLVEYPISESRDGLLGSLAQYCLPCLPHMLHIKLFFT
ncbi:hypothetical protein Peur_004967 [Populus x canadensis]